jgi:hypothetical protein
MSGRTGATMLGMSRSKGSGQGHDDRPWDGRRRRGARLVFAAGRRERRLRNRLRARSRRLHRARLAHGRQ